MTYLETQHLTKRFRRGNTSFEAVDAVDLSVEKGEFVSIMGRSGSGKTTLLSLIAGLISPDGGDVLLEGQSIFSLTESDLTSLRNNSIGFMPQGRSLLGNLTAIDNVRLPFYLKPRQGGSLDRALELMDQLGIAHLSKSRPSELSGGEMRRVTLARALINEPGFVVADEPTSDLDLKSAEDLGELLREINSRGVTILVATHDRELSSKFGRVLEMAEGKLVR
jgi:putative ABC transport system ATP-binding protein